MLQKGYECEKKGKKKKKTPLTVAGKKTVPKSWCYKFGLLLRQS
jgi:hypothetical protein